MYFLKNKVFTYFLLFLSVVVGWYMLNTTARELYPEIKIPTVFVSTAYPGASARDVEESVTDVLETSLVGGLKNINEITSTSQEGVSTIVAQFKDNVDIKEALIEVQDAVDEKKGELPDDALEPLIKKVSFSDQPIFTFALSSTSAYNTLRIQAEDIEDQLLKISGVSEVSIDGIPEREITLLLDPEKLSQFSISPQEVVSAISRSKQTVPAGSVIIDNREYRINYDSRIDTIEDVQNIVVQSPTAESRIYVSDLVLVIEDGLTRYNSQTRISTDLSSGDIQQAIIFNIKKQEGGNIIELTDAIKQSLEKYKNERSDEQINFVTIFDAGKDISTNLSELVGSGAQTIFIILIIMGLMVGLRESVIAAVAVPLSLLLTFIGMHFAGQTINFITLFSLILVIGILIDSAVVVVEGIYDFLNEGDDFETAARKTLVEYTKPIIAGVLTTISIFVPLMMLSGTLGQFIGGIPRVINIVLLMSLVVALVFIPAVARILYQTKIGTFRSMNQKTNTYLQTKKDRFLKILKTKHVLLRIWKVFSFSIHALGVILPTFFVRYFGSWLIWLMNRLHEYEQSWIKPKRDQIFDRITRWYRDFLTQLTYSSQNKRRVIWTLVVLFFTAFVLVGTGMIRSEFFPPDEIDRAFVNIELSQGSTLDQTSDATRIVENIIINQEHVIAFTTTIGQESVFVGSGRSGSHYANVVINVDDKKNGQKLSNVLRKELDTIQGFKVQVLVPESGPPVGAPFQVKVQGSSWEDINIAAEQIAETIRSIPAARDVNSGVDVGLTEIRLQVLHERLAEYGLSAMDVSALLRTTLYGTEATSLRIGNEGDVDVVVKVALDPSIRSHRQSNHVNFDLIKNIPIQTAQGEVLLGYFVEEYVDQATSVARHIDGNKNRTVTSYVQDGFLPNDIVFAFQEKIDDIELPKGVSVSLAGASDESSKASSELTASLGFGLLLIFTVLIWQFGSLRDVMFIISVIPLGLIGVLWGLFIFNMTLSFTAMLGFIALVGVVVNDSIILVDVMNKIRTRNPELAKREVVVRGASMRLRPVLLTTVTTVLGMIPLLFVSPIWKPFAFSMIVGLTFATVLTLVVIPILYEKWSK